MRPDEQAAPSLFSERAATKVAGGTTNVDTESSRPPRADRPPTQRDKVLRWLMAEEAVCSTTFLARYVPRAAAHIYALRRQAFVITSRPCTRPNHRHETHQIEYVLEALPYDSSGGAA